MSPHGSLPRMAGEQASQTVPCKWCGRETTMLGTKQCDRCWELSTRIESDPDLARRMLAALGT